MANGKLKKAEKVEVVTILKKSNLLNSVFWQLFSKKKAFKVLFYSKKVKKIWINSNNFKKLEFTPEYLILAKVIITS